MPEQLNPVPAHPANGSVAGSNLTELVEAAPEAAGEAVAANEAAWQAALRAKARGDTEVARRLREAGVIGTGPMDGSRRDPMFDRDDVLMCSPEEMEVVHDFNWAYEQVALGAFNDYAGQCVAIVNKTVLAVGGDFSRMRAEASAKAGVDPDRVVIFHVGCGEF